MSSGASVSTLDAHIITTEADGRLRGISPQRAREIINAAIVHGNVVAHFHGGLVSEEKGRKIAEQLLPLYLDAGAYPLFFVWRSGLRETLPGNLKEIVQNELVDRLLRHIMRWTVGRLRQERAGGPTAMPLDQALPTREEVDAQMRRRAAGDEPFAEESPDRLDNPELSADEQKMFRQELMSDPGLSEALNKVLTTDRLGGGLTPLPRASQKPNRIGRAVLADVIPGMAKGLSNPAALMTTLASQVIPVLGAVLRRYHDQVDHGVYPTVLEEFMRMFLLGELGGTIWQTIKKDTQDTFEESDRAGCLFVEALVAAAQAGTLPRLTLVGHSTGGVFIDNLLTKMKSELGPDSKFRADIAFLAPACTTRDFADMLDQSEDLIRAFRLFTMTDDAERADHLEGQAYPRSLLYLVAGALEREDDDSAYTPLVGLARYLAPEDTLSRLLVSSRAERARLARVRSFFEQPDRVVLSPSESGAPEGRQAAALKHGDFDNDPMVLRSLATIVKQELVI
ncbi:MAG TPA: hypothetical protein VJT72_09775 [Pseudonocardiaceae bacterium]|nr:hypothetical protein [Pseudonocardiaceae bacterium]